MIRCSMRWHSIKQYDRVHLDWRLKNAKVSIHLRTENWGWREHYFTFGAEEQEDPGATGGLVVAGQVEHLRLRGPADLPGEPGGLGIEILRDGPRALKQTAPNLSIFQQTSNDEIAHCSTTCDRMMHVCGGWDVTSTRSPCRRLRSGAKAGPGR